MTEKHNFFKNFNIFDLIVISIVILAISAVFLVKTGKYTTTTSEIAKETQEIEFDVVLRGKLITRNSEIFKAGEKCFITIRNVPYSKLEIVKSQQSAWEKAIADPKNPDKLIARQDPSTPYLYNFLVTLRDNAVITSDGPVIGGNKIKIGLPILLEGYDYRLNGVVSDIRVLKKNET